MRTEFELLLQKFEAMVKIRTFYFTLILTLFTVSSAFGTVYTTTGKNSWSPSNPGNSLTSSDEFIINHQVTLKGLTLASGGKITINSGGYLKTAWSLRFNLGSSIYVAPGGTLKISQLTAVNYSDDFVIDGSIITSNGTMANYQSGVITYNAGGSWSFNQMSFVNYGTMILNEDANWKNGSVAFSLGTVTINKELEIKNLSLSNNATILGVGQIDLKNGNGTFTSNGNINGCTGNGCIPPSTIGTVTYLAAPLTSGGTIVPVSGGSVSGTDCNSTVQALNDLTITADIEMGDLVVSPGVTVTIQTDKSLSVCHGVINEGTVLIKNNGSLVQTSTGDENSGEGTYLIERRGSSTALAYNSWASPFKSAKISEIFVNSNPCDIFAFEGSTQSWSYDYASGYSTTCNGNPVTFSSGLLIGGDGVMDQGRGYFVPGIASSTRTVTGDVNNGDVSIDVFATSLGNHPDWNLDDWNLVGNPYPCAIDLEQFYLENQGVITGSFYFWVDDQLNGTDYHQSDDYAVYAENVGTTANGGQAKRYVAAGQAFWVYAKQNGTIRFKNDMRVIGNNSNLFKTDGTSENTFVYLDVVNDSNNFNQCAVGFNPTSTNGFDESSDAPKGESGAGVSLGSLINGNPYSIQAFEKLETFESYAVPLSLYTNWAGDHTFHVSKFEGVGSNISVYLRDTKLNIDTDLKLSDYILFLDTGDYANRFELVFENTGTPTSVEDQMENTNLIKVYQNDKEVYVETLDQQQTIESVVLYDLVGKELMRTNEQLNSIVVIDGAILQTGTYIVKSRLIDGTIQTVKFLFVE